MALVQIAPILKSNQRVREFIMDTDADAANLPKDAAPGSTALACNTATPYIMNASGRWVILGGDTNED